MAGRGEQDGAGSVLAVGILGATLTFTAVLLPLLAALAMNQSVQNAADASALAAADTVSGFAAGYPCQAAAEAARLGGASVTDCALDGLIATVSVQRRFLVFDLAAEARAGPP
ncbi:hypothetical protein E3T53_12155 [Cryobacterium psychrophilum]|uniref:Helicase n=2 Tax=Cryobacterium psychrophilum TaxID=41988 RepID=A0A4Y8KM85_9MICO|nr:hypothetical protein E3T53_12155 [Cryobacterium psychrophilum]